MAHPFTKMLEKALKKSTAEDNEVLVEALKILKKGYREEEIVGVLERMATGRIDPKEESIIQEAIDEIVGEEDFEDEEDED